MPPPVTPPNFDASICQSITHKPKFGLCDDPHPAHTPAYIDERDGTKWIAVVSNLRKFEINFTAIDHCILLLRPDGKTAPRCDAMLRYKSDALGQTVIFIELKARNERGAEWIKTAENQLKSTLSFFEDTAAASAYKVKKCFIANKAMPHFRTSQMVRMDNFLFDTGYVLRIENRLELD